MIEGYLDREVLAIDFETSGFNPRKDEILGVSLSDGKTAYYFHWDELKKKKEEGEIIKIFARKKVKKILFNAKFDLGFAWKNGLDIREATNFEDPMIMSHLYDENLPSHSLKALAVKFIDPNADFWEKKLKNYLKENKLTSYRDLPRDLLAEYGRMDAFYTMALYEFFKDKIEKEFKVIYEIERDLVLGVLRMEMRGVKVDKRFLREQGERMKQEFIPLGKELKRILKVKNLASNLEVGEALSRMGYNLPRTRTGQVQIDRWTLGEIGDKLTGDITKWRQLTHLHSTYCEGIPEKAEKGILHCQFNQMGAKTGRFSSSDPNLQNIPRELEDLRKAFLVRKGYTMVYFDYSQIEMILLAYYSRDPNMLSAIKEGKDLHLETAKLFFQVGEPNEDQRNIAKHLNFAIVYGMGARGLSKKFKTDSETAERFLSRYFSLYPRIKEFRDLAGSRARVRGFVVTLFGRFRRLRPDESYKAVNAIIQGSAADIIKVAMVKVDKLLQGTRSFLVIQIHDELQVEIHNQELELIKKIVEVMEDVPQLEGIPLKVEVKTSTTNWGGKNGPKGRGSQKKNSGEPETESDIE